MSRQVLMNKKRQIKDTVKRHIPQRHISSIRIMYRIAMETVYGIKRTGLLNIAIIAAIAAILTIFGALFRTSFSLSSYVDNLGNTFEISVYLRQNTDPVYMSSRIKEIEHVRKVTIKTKEEAWEATAHTRRSKGERRRSTVRRYAWLVPRSDLIIGEGQIAVLPFSYLVSQSLDQRDKIIFPSKCAFPHDDHPPA